MSGYGDFSAFYDELTDDVDYPAWADYLLALVSRHGGRAAQVLDLACGTGGLSLPLAARGCEVVAVDGSPDMLTVAREKAAEQGADILFLCQDMRSLDLYGTVDATFCLLDGLNHLLHTAEIAEVFRRLGLFIAPDGLLIFDANTPYKHRTVLGDNTFAFEKDDLLCLWRNHTDPKRGETTMRLDFFLTEGEEDGALCRRYTDEVRERAYARRTWERLLDEAGFSLLAVYGERSFAAPEEQAERWVFVARNRAIGQKNEGERSR